MKRSRSFFFAFLLAVAVSLLAACGTTLFGPAGAASAPTATVFDRIGVAQRTVTAVREASVELLLAKKITKAQDQVVQTDLDLIRDALTSAATINPTNPAQALQLLSSALTQLAALESKVAGPIPGATP